ncbi:hypothetical protein [Nocardiopsis ansamitocini]|uniref:hypothetical protein n=1 Tax=Nocardiopsis ansamitocini TaxID=1670832 RepID=UPI002555A772|nr:hypothetical protein [Nocardiopsis ansamitocini]
MAGRAEKKLILLDVPDLPEEHYQEFRDLHGSIKEVPVNQNHWTTERGRYKVTFAFSGIRETWGGVGDLDVYRPSAWVHGPR